MKNITTEQLSPKRLTYHLLVFESFPRSRNRYPWFWRKQRNISTYVKNKLSSHISQKIRQIEERKHSIPLFCYSNLTLSELVHIIGQLVRKPITGHWKKKGILLRPLEYYTKESPSNDRLQTSFFHTTYVWHSFCLVVCL